jgi:hypothetical protein
MSAIVAGDHSLGCGRDRWQPSMAPYAGQILVTGHRKVLTIRATGKIVADQMPAEPKAAPSSANSGICWSAGNLRLAV